MAASLPAPLTRPMTGAETARRRGTTSAGPAPRSDDDRGHVEVTHYIMLRSAGSSPPSSSATRSSRWSGAASPRCSAARRCSGTPTQVQLSSSVDGLPCWPCLCRSGGPGPPDPGAGQAECVDHIRPQIPPGETTTTEAFLFPFFLDCHAGDTLDSANFSQFFP